MEKKFINSLNNINQNRYYISINDEYWNNNKYNFNQNKNILKNVLDIKTIKFINKSITNIEFLNFKTYNVTEMKGCF